MGAHRPQLAAKANADGCKDPGSPPPPPPPPPLRYTLLPYTNTVRLHTDADPDLRRGSLTNFSY